MGELRRASELVWVGESRAIAWVRAICVQVLGTLLYQRWLRLFAVLSSHHISRRTSHPASRCRTDVPAATQPMMPRPLRTPSFIARAPTVRVQHTAIHGIGDLAPERVQWREGNPG